MHIKHQRHSSLAHFADNHDCEVTLLSFSLRFMKIMIRLYYKYINHLLNIIFRGNRFTTTSCDLHYKRWWRFQPMTKWKNQAEKAQKKLLIIAGIQ